MTASERIALTVSDPHTHADARVEEWEWRMSQSLVFDVEVDRAQARGLHWRVESHHFGCLVAARMDLSPQRILRTGANFSRGGIDHVMVDVVMSGGLSGQAQGRRLEAGAGDVMVLDLAQTSTLAVQADTELLSWVVPRALFDACRDPGALHGRVFDAASPPGALLGSHLRQMVALSARLDAGQARAYGQATALLMTQVLAPHYGAEAAPESPDSLLGRVCAHIETRLGDPDLNPAALCARFALSRAVLYRLFEPGGGVAAYIRQRRLLSARRALLDPRKRHLQVAQIAHLHCLEPASFSRMFLRAFGQTPREARTGQPAARDGLPDDALHLEWFKSL